MCGGGGVSRKERGRKGRRDDRKMPVREELGAKEAKSGEEKDKDLSQRWSVRWKEVSGVEVSPKFESEVMNIKADEMGGWHPRAVRR